MNKRPENWIYFKIKGKMVYNKVNMECERDRVRLAYVQLE